MVNFDFRGGALALNRLVTAVPLSSLRQSKALKSCMMPQMGYCLAPGLQRGFCMNPATFAILQQAGRGAYMAVTSEMRLSTSRTAQCLELQLMALSCAHTEVGAEQELCSQRNHGSSKNEERQGAPSGLRRKIQLLQTEVSI